MTASTSSSAISSVPWRRGESSLYTRDSFDAVRQVLAPGGLYCQWVPLYQISEGRVRQHRRVVPRRLPADNALARGLPRRTGCGRIDRPHQSGRARRRERGCTLAGTDVEPGSQQSIPFPSSGPLAVLRRSARSAEHRFRSALRNRDANPWVELASYAAAPADSRRRGEAVHRQAAEASTRHHAIRAARRNRGGIAAGRAHRVARAGRRDLDGIAALVRRR